MVNNSNDSKLVRNFLIAGGIIFFFIMISIISNISDASNIVKNESNKIKIETEEHKIKEVSSDKISNDEIEYAELILKFNSYIISIDQAAADVSTAASTGKITAYQAGDLFIKAENTYNIALITLDEFNVPTKYKIVHQHYRQAIIYKIEAMYLIADGFYMNDVDKIDAATNYIYLATTEIEKAISIIENF